MGKSGSDVRASQCDFCGSGLAVRILGGYYCRDVRVYCVSVCDNRESGIETPSLSFLFLFICWLCCASCERQSECVACGIRGYSFYCIVFWLAEKCLA